MMDVLVDILEATLYELAEHSLIEAYPDELESFVADCEIAWISPWFWLVQIIGQVLFVGRYGNDTYLTASLIS